MYQALSWIFGTSTLQWTGLSKCEVVALSDAASGFSSCVPYWPHFSFLLKSSTQLSASLKWCPHLYLFTRQTTGWYRPITLDPSQPLTENLMLLFGVHFLAAWHRWLSHCCIDSDGNISYCQAMTSRASSELPIGWRLFPITGSTGAQAWFKPIWRISSFHRKPPWLGPKPKRHNSLKSNIGQVWFL